MVYFETERLVFRDWKEKDLDEFRTMNKDPRVMKYFAKALSEQETEAFYSVIKAEFEKCGYGLYAVETKHNREFIGFIGFHWASFNAPFTPCIEIGWRLKAEAWGNGYATEGAKACLNYGFEKLNFDKIYSFTSKMNLPSENVMKKIGMSKVKEFDHPNIAEDSPLKRHVLYGAFRFNGLQPVKDADFILEKASPGIMGKVICLLTEIFSGEQGIPEGLIPVNEEFKPVYWCARAGGDIAAVAAGWTEKGQWHWGRFAVDRRLRGFGIGRRIAEFSLNEIFSLGAGEVSIEARDSAVVILKQLGGVVTGGPEDFYGQPVTPVVVRKPDYLGRRSTL